MHDLLRVHSLRELRSSYLIASLVGLVAVRFLPSAHGHSLQRREITKLVQIDTRRRMLVDVSLGGQGRHSEARVSVGKAARVS
jgi:hypothetical protein